MLLLPSRFRRFPLATHRSHNCPKAKTGLVTRPRRHSADGGVHRYPVEVLQGGGTGQGRGVMFTARGFGHLINNTVRRQAAKQLQERGRLPRHQGPRAHTDAP